MEKLVIKGKANQKNKKLHEMSIVFCYACCRTPTAPYYRFDLCYVKILILFSKRVSRREQMQTKTLYNLLIYIDEDYKKDDFSRLRLYRTPASTHLLRQHTLAAYYQLILLKKSRIKCCLWSTQCIETHARTSDNVKTGVFVSINV